MNAIAPHSQDVSIVTADPAVVAFGIKAYAVPSKDGVTVDLEATNYDTHGFPHRCRAHGKFDLATAERFLDVLAQAVQRARQMEGVSAMWSPVTYDVTAAENPQFRKRARHNHPRRCRLSEDD